jgi:nicotinic acid mononucleotide adenylyltransferase
LELPYSSIIFFRSKQKRKIKTSYDTEVRIAKNFDELANDVYQTMAFVEMQDLSYSYNKDTTRQLRHHILEHVTFLKKTVLLMGPDYIPNLKR